ncbi:MAG: class I SAM-dependent methyltransferase [Minisyncoccia bacterium]
MANESTIDYYDNQSGQYSQKRYEGKTETYFQFLFKRRRQIFLGFIASLGDFKDFRLFEIGCADGVLIKKILQKMPNSFSKIVGIDISPKMLEKARATTADSRVSYFLRGEEDFSIKYNLVLEVGVHVSDLLTEVKFVSNKLSVGGYFIYSTAGKNSLHARIKLRDKDYAKEYITYFKCEEILNRYFEIISSQGYGLFIPKLWAVPALARVVQPIAEALFRKILPNLFHEKIYLLRKKN